MKMIVLRHMVVVHGQVHKHWMNLQWLKTHAQQKPAASVHSHKNLIPCFKIIVIIIKIYRNNNIFFLKIKLINFSD